MSDKQYYVQIKFEYGVDNGDGTYTMKNDGMARWVSMPYDNGVGLQNYAVIPALNMMNTKAGELGLMTSSVDFEGLGFENPLPNAPEKKAGTEPKR